MTASHTLQSPGVLYVVGVPIGHPDDLTVRAIDVLKAADVIASEDPRSTQALLAHHHIVGQITSYHHENRDEKTAVLIDRLSKGTRLALVSDAGTPGVYDPGAFLIRAALQRGIHVAAVPGPSCVTAALSVSGTDGDRFTFAGRLPRGRRAQREWLRRIAALDDTLIVFSEPSGLTRTLRALREGLGDRRLSVCRNLTSVGEQVTSTTLDALLGEPAREHPTESLTLVVERARRPRRARRRRAGGERPGEYAQAESSRRRITTR